MEESDGSGRETTTGQGKMRASEGGKKGKKRKTEAKTAEMVNNAYSWALAKYNE